MTSVNLLGVVRIEEPQQIWECWVCFDVAMGQNPNRTPSEHPNPTTKIPPKMGGAPAPKWEPIGFDPQPCYTPLTVAPVNGCLF